MVSSALAAVLARHNIHYGWVIVAVTFLTTIVTAAAMSTAGVLASLAMTQVWQLVLLWGIVVGVGTGLTAMVLAVTVATRWFNARRGLVMGVFAASNATGQLIFLPLIAALATNYGWRMSLVFIFWPVALAGI